MCTTVVSYYFDKGIQAAESRLKEREEKHSPTSAECSQAELTKVEHSAEAERATKQLVFPSILGHFHVFGCACLHFPTGLTSAVGVSK